ncbi:MAG: phytanoyl-CoA dioxygenase family protein [Fimbriimonas sp.]
MSEATSVLPITAEERAAFEEQGYHVVRGAIGPDEVAIYRDALVRVLGTSPDHAYASRLLTAQVPDAPPTLTNPRGIWAGFDLPLFDSIFYDFAFSPRIALSVAGLLGPDVNLFETSFVSKVPGFPGNFRDWHQDTEYSDPQSNDSLVTVITYLDAMDGESGGTWVCPGTHKLGALAHAEPTEEYSSNAREVANKAEYDRIGFCPKYQPGDTLIFKARLVHKSGSNLSSTDRLSLAYNYVTADTLDYKEVNRYIGSSTPVVRDGKPYIPGDTLRQRLSH